MDEQNNSLKTIMLAAGFVAIVVAIAGAVYAALKYFERKQEEEIMDYYFDEDEDYDELLEDEAEEPTLEEEAPVEE